MSETNVTIINMQPTTDYVNIGGPLINPSEYATKNEINEKLDNYATVKQATDIARNITDSALENGYYTSSEIDGKLDCKSNTDHTHTNIYNELTINSNSFKLLSSKSKYTTFTMGKNDKNYESAVIGYGDDYMGKYLYMRINGGKQLTLYGDRATLEADLTVTSLNGITPSTISLNTHNHDDKYALVDHTHDDKYSKLDHAHEYNDIKNNYFQEKEEYKAGLGNDDVYIVYDASEKLKEAQEKHSDPVSMKIRFFENVEITATSSSVTIQVGTKKFVFTESGLTNGSTEKA